MLECMACLPQFHRRCDHDLQLVLQTSEKKKSIRHLISFHYEDFNTFFYPLFFTYLKICLWFLGSFLVILKTLSITHQL